MNFFFLIFFVCVWKSELSTCIKEKESVLEREIVFVCVGERERVCVLERVCVCATC